MDTSICGLEVDFLTSDITYSNATTKYGGACLNEGQNRDIREVSSHPWALLSLRRNTGIQLTSVSCDRGYGISVLTCKA